LWYFCGVDGARNAKWVRGAPTLHGIFRGKRDNFLVPPGRWLLPKNPGPRKISGGPWFGLLALSALFEGGCLGGGGGGGV